MDRRLAELRDETLGHFDDIYKRFERLEQEYQLKQHVEALQSRIEEIERRLGR